jgi:anti-sigma factor RsiW
VETHHLSSEELAAYLEGLVTPAERERIEAHLVQCDRCLDEVLSALRHVRPKPPGPGD